GPRVLLRCAGVMRVAFWGVTIPPTAASPGVALTAMIAWQAVLGGVMGIIYAGSLYFGMVLSKGSTEHGGYHEALIGVGSVLGPGIGALAAAAYPGDAWPGILAVSVVITVSVIAVGAVNFRYSKSPAN